MMDAELAKALVFEEDHPDFDKWSMVDEDELYHKHDTRYVYSYFESKETGEAFCVVNLTSYSYGSEYEEHFPVRKETVIKTIWKAA